MQVRGCHGTRLTCRTRIDSFDWRPLLVSETVVTCLANRWREWPRAACGCWVTKRFAQGARECDGSGAWENDKADANGLVWYLVPAIENPIWKSGSRNEGPLLVFVGATEGRSRSWTRRCRSCATPSTSRSTCRRSCSTTAATRTTRPAAAPTACRPWTTPGPLTSRTSVPWRVVVFYCPFTYACESNYFSFHGSQGPKGLTVKVEVRTRNETTNKLVFPSTSPAGGTQTRPSYGLDSSTVAHLAAKPHNSFECLATSFSRTANFQQKNTRVAY